jgi:hypothetical protein
MRLDSKRQRHICLTLNLRRETYVAMPHWELSCRTSCVHAKEQYLFPCPEIKLLAHSVRILARYFDHVQNRCPAFFSFHYLQIILPFSTYNLPDLSFPCFCSRWLCLQLSNILWCFNFLGLPSVFHVSENKMLHELAYLLVLKLRNDIFTSLIHLPYIFFLNQPLDLCGSYRFNGWF